jgi:DNA helicase-2/ATP-dependent DNA helicase PcrA
VVPIDLTDEQRVAVRAPGNTWVIACPGSGKTRVALAKILRESAYLEPQKGSVLALSFSVNAKDELASRVSAHAGPSSRQRVFVATIHGFCLGEILIPFGSYAGQGELQLALEGGTPYENAVAETAENLNITTARVKATLEYRRRAPDGRTFKGDTESTAREHEIATTFWALLLNSRYVDYPNALYVTLEILRANKWIREGIAARYPVVVVDEYQDCTDIQVAVVEQLVASGSSAFLVGDLFQCVFGFAGADVTTLRAFADRVGAARLTLHGTHRCPTRVIEVAERVFSRGMEAVGEASNRVSRVFVDHSSSPLPAIRRLVELCGQNGIAADEVAFVCSANYRIEDIVSALNGAGTPAAFGRSRVSENDWYGQLIESYLLAMPPRSERDLLRFTEAANEVVARFAIGRKATTALKRLVAGAVIETVLSTEALPDEELGRIALHMNESIMTALQNSQALQRKDLVEVERRLSEARNIFGAKAEARRERNAVVDALRPEGKVRGYTYQGIKGLQFRGVAVVDVARNLLPHRTLGDLWGDARRLYVGITRSQGFLAVHAPAGWDQSMFYPIIMGQASSQEVIGVPLPDSLRTLDVIV